MEKLYFITSGELIALNVKGEFQKAACRHEFRKGKITSEENLRKRKRPGKDICLCIKCGMRKGEANGYKSISNETVRAGREQRGGKGNSNSHNREERRRNQKAEPKRCRPKTSRINTEGAN